MNFEISLDDGRSVTKKAKGCPSDMELFFDKKGCPVSISIELDLGDSERSFVLLRGVGYDVEFK